MKKVLIAIPILVTVVGGVWVAVSHLASKTTAKPTVPLKNQAGLNNPTEDIVVATPSLKPDILVQFCPQSKGVKGVGAEWHLQEVNHDAKNEGQNHIA